MDDIGRSSVGFYGWVENFRPLTQILMQSINFGGNDLDLSPLPLILSLVIYSLVSVKYISTLSSDNNQFYITIGSIGALLNPFYLQNLSFKYDVLSMTISMCLIMLCFISTKISLWRFITHILLIVSSLCFYQASIGLFLSLTVIEVLRYSRDAYSKNIKVKTIYASISIRIFEVLFSYLIYSLIVKFAMAQYINQYTLENSRLIPLNVSAIDILLKNIEIFYTYRISIYFNSMPSWLVYIIAASLISVVISIASKYIFTKNNDCENKLKKLPIAMILIVSPVLVLVFSSIHLILLAHPVKDPRVLVSFSALTLFICSLPALSMHARRLLSLVSLLFVLFQFNYSYSYGNALNALDKYETFITTLMAMDISDADPNGKLNLQVTGKMAYPENALIVIKKYPSIENLLDRPLIRNWYWTSFQLRRFGIKNPKGGITEFSEITNGVLLKERTEYTLVRQNNNLIVNFK